MILVNGYNAASDSLGVALILGAKACVVDVEPQGFFSSYPTIIIALFCHSH